MITAIIVDDEIRGIGALTNLLEEYCRNIKVIATCKNAEDAREKIESLSPQLVFLDISLPDKNSFELLTELESINFEIIFVTAYNDFVLQAFQYSAVDYLMKPIDEDLLVESVKRASTRIYNKEIHTNTSALLHNLTKTNNPQEMKLCIPSVKGFQVIDLKDILYCEGSSSYTNIYFTTGSSVCTSKTIHEYEDMLEDNGFMRIHKSYLVNLLHVKEYLRGEGGSVILSNKKELEISRRKKDEFMRKIKTFYKM